MTQTVHMLSRLQEQGDIGGKVILVGGWEPLCPGHAQWIVVNCNKLSGKVLVYLSKPTLILESQHSYHNTNFLSDNQLAIL